jgi:hypothetical protein
MPRHRHRQLVGLAFAEHLRRLAGHRVHVAGQRQHACAGVRCDRAAQGLGHAAVALAVAGRVEQHDRDVGATGAQRPHPLEQRRHCGAVAAVMVRLGPVLAGEQVRAVGRRAFRRQVTVHARLVDAGDLEAEQHRLCVRAGGPARGEFAGDGGRFGGAVHFAEHEHVLVADAGIDDPGGRGGDARDVARFRRAGGLHGRQANQYGRKCGQASLPHSGSPCDGMVGRTDRAAGAKFTACPKATPR